MNSSDLSALLMDLKNGKSSVEATLEKLLAGPFQNSDLGFAVLDHHRSLRSGMGEVVYGESKSIDQIISINQKLSQGGRVVLTTRLNEEKQRALKDYFPHARIHPQARTAILNTPLLEESESQPSVVILAAGTSDFSVAEEAAETLVAFGVRFDRIYDVGVAGLHRLLSRLEKIRRAQALIVVAGMEGALPSVVAGLVAKPIFAVPTSVGYGANFGGISALLTMLNSCASGVSVVNIDNGFSAAFSAAQVITQIKQFKLDERKNEIPL